MPEPSPRKWRTLRSFGAEEEHAEFSGASAEGIDLAPVHAPVGPQPVLLVLPSAPTSRLVRETLENFTEAKVDSTSDPVRAFEMALQKPYRVLIFAMEIGEMAGPILYELIAKACSTGYGPRRLAPGVIFVRESREVAVSDELVRDARVKDILSKPIRIERLLRSVEGILEKKDPTARG